MDKDLLVLNPILTAVNWINNVSNIDIINAHIKLYPNFAPAIEHIVTVPGPINAAAMTDPGPIFFNL